MPRHYKNPTTNQRIIINILRQRDTDNDSLAAQTGLARSSIRRMISELNQMGFTIVRIEGKYAIVD